MTTTDIIAVVAAAIVTAFVCATLLARTRDVPPTSRLPIALMVTTGLCALVILVAVPTALEGAGRGEPSTAFTSLTQAAVAALTSPVTLIGTILAADVGFLAGWLRLRRHQRGRP